MTANEANLNRFLSQPNTQFVIPVYQRNYDWEKTQCGQLLDDIFAVGANRSLTSHFIGSIVYIHDSVYSSTRTRELTIIDGQQRLTTVSLIYLVLYTLAKQMGNQRLVAEIEETYLTNKFAEESEKLKLRPTENNNKVYQYLLRNDPHEVFGDYSRLVENFNFFLSRIHEDNFEIIRDGLAKLVFVEISLERGKDDPQRIFESLNSTGLDLSQADLIRNYILMELEARDQEQVYDRYWRHIESNARVEDFNQSRVSEFIRDFLTIENRDIPTKGKVYLEFKKKYHIKERQFLEPVLGQLKKYSVYYHKLLNPGKESDLEIRRQLSWINLLEINVAYPFLLEVYEDYATGIINKQQFTDVLELVQCFTWRRFIVGLPTNALNKIFMRLHEDVDPKDYLISLQRALIRKRGTQRFPRDGEVRGALREKDMYNIQSKNRIYFLERLENFQNREHVQISGNQNITVEHILPQKPDPKWKVELGEDELRYIRENYLNTAANLTLSGNNGSLGNKYFTEKRDMNVDGKEQGYRFSRLWLNKDLAELNVWNKAAIEARAERIADRFMQIWPFPDLEEEEGFDETAEVNIFDAEDPTHKKLEYAVFFDQKLEVQQVAQLYRHVISALFELNPEVFLHSELKDRLSLTRDRNQLRQWMEINGSYYIEGNIDNRSKFDRIKQALSIMELADELLIKYAN